jgi:hypothetical protein
MSFSKILVGQVMPTPCPPVFTGPVLVQVLLVLLAHSQIILAVLD